MAGNPDQAREVGRTKGGRKTGSLTKMSRLKANELARSNHTPLDVMIENMLWWRDKAREFGTLLESKMAELVKMNSDDKDPSYMEKQQDLMIEIAKIGRTFMAAREGAQRCAVDAAPYVHPRFQSIEWRGTFDVRDTRKVSEEMSQVEASMAYASTLKARADNKFYAPPIMETAE